ncbi:MAG TPA: hypothetical protein VKH45_01345 [Candidatus Acidoferrum sp.]|nr:hypothetical protein [Candidatus Acidoferrum sp.]
MSDPELIDRIIESCSFRFRSVLCPNKEKVAKIAAARMQADEAEWTIVECSLEPNGEVRCAMDCLLKEMPPES